MDYSWDVLIYDFGNNEKKLFSVNLSGGSLFEKSSAKFLIFYWL